MSAWRHCDLGVQGAGRAFFAVIILCFGVFVFCLDFCFVLKMSVGFVVVCGYRFFVLASFS